MNTFFELNVMNDCCKPMVQERMFFSTLKEAKKAASKTFKKIYGEKAKWNKAKFQNFGPDYNKSCYMAEKSYTDYTSPDFYVIFRREAK